jgi:MerR family transcriptional regulator/heat shock protein HspR
MEHSCAQSAASAIENAPPQDAAAPKRIKIGAVARRFGVSVDLLRLYEREGLLIPLKSPKGTRYFTELDYPWIDTVLRLVREARLNFAGIRHLLALLPCWEIRGCDENRRRECNITAGASAPCWTLQACCRPEDCYACPVYRSASQCKNLRAFVVKGPA